MAASFILGPGVATHVLNFFYRGVTPPALPDTLYMTLGTGTGGALTEISGITRAPIPRHRGAWGGHSSQSSSEYPYQSDGVTSGADLLLYPTFLRLPSAFAEFTAGIGNQLPNMWCMVFDAASGGNLMLACIVNYYNAGYSAAGYRGNDLLQMHRSLGHPDATQFAYGGATGVYVRSMVSDWVLRGYDSLTQLFPVGTYPDLVMRVRIDPYSTPWVTVPRNTSVWGAPVAGAGAYRTKMPNLVNIDFPSFPQTQIVAQNTGVFVDTALAPPPQVADMSLNSVVYALPSQVSFTNGDTFRFPAGQLEIVEGPNLS